MLVRATGLALDGLPFRTARGEQRLSVIAKVTFALVDGEDARLVDPLPLFDDVRFENNEERSLLLASDRVPLKPRVDVLFAGAVYAPPLERVIRRDVRFAIEDHAGLVLERKLVAHGARQRSPSGEEGEATPFAFLPMRYELAYGGPSSKSNPVGMGADPADPRLPQLVDPIAPKRIACLGPIAPSWWQRARYRGALAEGAPTLELPPDLEPDYFQAAPPDQQVERLTGHEWIILDGLHASRHRVRSRLPGVDLAVTLQAKGASPIDVALRIDTLFVDGDALQCALTLRGHVAFDHAALDGATLAGAIAQPEASPESASVAAKVPRWVGGGAPAATRSDPPRPFAPAPASALPSAPPASAPAEEPAPAPSPPLPKRTGETVPFDNDSRFVVVTRPWQVRPPESVLVVIVKGTFDLVEGAAAKLSEEQLPPSGDVKSADAETSSLRYASDFAVYKPSADVLMVGHAYPIRDPKAPEAELHVARVRLRVGALEREVVVLGDRSWESHGVPTAPAKFERMPLVWERAFGSALSPDNPVGRGFGTGLLLPNLERRDVRLSTPRQRDVAPICFAPIDPRWRPRASLLGTYDRTWLRERWPYYPLDFDHRHFNAAAPELQVPFLAGDERFALSGVDPEVPTFEGTLPGVRPRVYAMRTEAAGAAFFEVEMNLDTVWFDADAKKLVLVFRGLVIVRDDEASDLAQLCVTQAPVGEPPTLEAARAKFVARLPVPAASRAGASGDRVAANEATPAEALPEPPPAPPAVSREQIVAWLAAGTSLAGKDLTGADLSALDLHGQDLSGTILARANLREADLGEARLEKVVLDGADATGARLGGANLTRASLAECVLEGADLSGATLDRATLADARCDGARLSSVHAHGARFLRASLARAVFDGADLAAAELSSATLSGASFAKATLTDARFYDASGDKLIFDGAQMVGARMDRASLPGGSFVEVDATRSAWSGADLSGAVFQSAVLDDALMPKAILRGAVLDRARARGASFKKAVLASAMLRRCDLMRATFHGADLRDADMRGANLFEVETWTAKLDGSRLELAHIAGSRLAGPLGKQT